MANELTKETLEELKQLRAEVSSSIRRRFELCDSASLDEMEMAKYNYSQVLRNHAPDLLATARQVAGLRKALERTVPILERVWEKSDDQDEINTVSALSHDIAEALAATGEVK